MQFYQLLKLRIKFNMYKMFKQLFPRCFLSLNSCVSSEGNIIRTFTSLFSVLTMFTWFKLYVAPRKNHVPTTAANNPVKVSMNLINFFIFFILH